MLLKPVGGLVCRLFKWLASKKRSPERDQSKTEGLLRKAVAVFALGSSCYPRFCEAGKTLFAMLQSAGEKKAPSSPLRKGGPHPPSTAGCLKLWDYASCRVSCTRCLRAALTFASCPGARNIAPLGIGDAQGGREEALRAWLSDAAKGLAEAGYGQQACNALVEKLQRGIACEEGFLQQWDAVNIPG